MTVPARWRLVREDDHLTRWQCDGDGVDLCRAPATWVAERDYNYLGEDSVKIIAQRCPDHIPVRAFAGSTLPAPPSREDPTVKQSDGQTIETPVAPLAVETEPALADTQQEKKFESPVPTPTADSRPPTDEESDDETPETD